LKLSAASRGESSILQEQYHSVFGRLTRGKLREMRSLPNSKKAINKADKLGQIHIINFVDNQLTNTATW